MRRSATAGREHGGDKAALAAQVWEHLFDFILATASHRTSVLAAHALTPNDSRALHALDARTGRTMSSLAAAWGCDASYATALIDRLVQRGLVARRDEPADRRVKLVVLTPLGVKTRAAIRRAMYRPPPELLALSTADLAALRRATATLAKRPARPDARAGAARAARAARAR